MPPSFAVSPTLPLSTRRKALAGLAAAHATASRGPSLILPRLYLTNWTVASDEALLAELGVTHVVSVLEFPPEYSGAAAGVRTLHVRVEDTFRTDILAHLDGTTAFIRAALEENETNKVLVRVSVWPRCAMYPLTRQRAGALSHGRVPLDDRRVCVPHRDDAHERPRGDRVRGETADDRLAERRVPPPAGDVRAAIRAAGR